MMEAHSTEAWTTDDAVNPGQLAGHGVSVIAKDQGNPGRSAPSIPDCAVIINYCGVSTAVFPNEWRHMGRPHCDLENNMKDRFGKQGNNQVGTGWNHRACAGEHHGRR